MTPSTTANRRRTLLPALATALLFLVPGALLSLVLGPVVLLVAALLAALVLLLAVRLGAPVALATVGAVPCSADDYPRYHNLVEGLSRDAGLAMPRLLVIDHPAPNALAVGWSSTGAALAVTTGLLQRLNRIELEGVLAHELILIRTLAIRPRTLAVLLGGLPALLRHRPGAGPLAALGALLAAPLVPLLRIAVPPSTELEADQIGAELTRYPPGLAQALSSLQRSEVPMPTSALAVNHLWLVPPTTLETLPGPVWSRPAGNHVPLPERITALLDL